MSSHWNRRQLLPGTALLAAGTLTRRSSAQMPAPERLEDPTLTFVTTTESAPWQPGKLFKPAFAYETLNLALDPTPAQTIEGFGACFNELGWTSLSALTEADRAPDPLRRHRRPASRHHWHR